MTKPPDEEIHLPMGRLLPTLSCRQCGDPCAVATEEKLTEVYAGTLP